jgi:hypothetical protein
MTLNAAGDRLMASPETSYHDYQLFDLSREGSRLKIRDLIHPAIEVRNQAALGVLDAAFGHPDVRTAIVESDYVDVDHSRSYANFYARAYHDHAKRTKRVHFFRTRLTRAHLKALDQWSDTYLGFVVVRPFGMRTVGRSILSPPPGSAPHEHGFVTLQGSFGANVAGTSVVAGGCPFIEQDARVSACASAAIWMSTASMNQRLNLTPRTTAEITEYATRLQVGSRRVQSEGLVPDQMSESLRAIGYEPMQIPVGDRDAAMATLYPYIESGISPIILIQLEGGYHAVAGVGHSFNPSKKPVVPVSYQWVKPLRFWRSWQWVDDILVHDDQRGPYRPLSFLAPSAAISPSALPMPNWDCPVEIGHDYTHVPGGHPVGLPRATIGNVYGMIIPLPSGVSLSAVEAEKKVARLIAMWAQALGIEVPPNLHLRTHLAMSNEFKSSLASKPSLHGFARDLYRGKGLPHWLWVTEVGLLDEVVTSKLGDSRIRGEILVDANSSPWLPDFVALHLPFFDAHGTPTGKGQLSTMRRTDDDVARALSSGWLLSGDVPYEPFARRPV